MRDWIILRVNVDNLPGLKLHRDNLSKSGVIAWHDGKPIPPERISLEWPPTK
jgi:hypothetical protein